MDDEPKSGTWRPLDDLIGLPLRKLRNRLVPIGSVWQRGLSSELGFWERYFATGGLEWREKYRARLDPDTPVQERTVRDCLTKLGGTSIAVLDVGAGPCTVLGKVHEGRPLRITAVDPLAHAYSAMLERFHVSPPIRTLPGDGERLAELFASESFDLVYCRNALDHCYDPLLALTCMLEVVRRRGFVVLIHGIDEAETSRYRGLHQWNVCQRRGELIIWNQAITHDVSALLAGRAVIECHDEDGQLAAVLQRT
jgi:SAM-dependent methyltransferase